MLFRSTRLRASVFFQKANLFFRVVVNRLQTTVYNVRFFVFFGEFGVFSGAKSTKQKPFIKFAIARSAVCSQFSKNAKSTLAEVQRLTHYISVFIKFAVARTVLDSQRTSNQTRRCNTITTPYISSVFITFVIARAVCSRFSKNIKPNSPRLTHFVLHTCARRGFVVVNR